MTQIFIFGASIVYGVGAEEAGWADLIKRDIHNRMYSSDGVGEKYEVYNFGNPGATIDFVSKTSRHQIKNYQKDGKKILILSIGMNNAKAKGTPENYVSTIGEYKSQMTDLLNNLKENIDHIICVGLTPVDEQKTTPKTPGGSYFWNDRVKEFDNTFKQVCEESNITFVDVDVDPKVWKQQYLFKDGLHPNQKGHQLIFDKIIPQLEVLL